MKGNTQKCNISLCSHQMLSDSCVSFVSPFSALAAVAAGTAVIHIAVDLAAVAVLAVADTTAVVA